MLQELSGWDYPLPQLPGFEDATHMTRDPSKNLDPSRTSMLLCRTTWREPAPGRTPLSLQSNIFSLRWTPQIEWMSVFLLGVHTKRRATHKFASVCVCVFLCVCVWVCVFV